MIEHSVDPVVFRAIKLLAKYVLDRNAHCGQHTDVDQLRALAYADSIKEFIRICRLHDCEYCQGTGVVHAVSSPDMDGHATARPVPCPECSK